MIKHSAGVLENVQISVKHKLSAFWAALMFLYVYADVLSLFRPGQIDEIMQGRMGPFRVSQVTLLIASVLVIVPAMMIFLSLIMKPTANRWTNIMLGLVFTLVGVSNLIGETWVYYLLFGILEIVLTLTIIAFAWKWPTHER